MTDEEWADMSVDEKLDWARATLEGLIKSNNHLFVSVLLLREEVEMAPAAPQTDPPTDGS